MCRFGSHKGSEGKISLASLVCGERGSGRPGANSHALGMEGCKRDIGYRPSRVASSHVSSSSNLAEIEHSDANVHVALPTSL